MPSPVGHVIGGVAAGWLVAGTPAGAHQETRRWREAALFGALAALPDLDLAFLVMVPHRGPTHGLGTTLIVAVVAAAWFMAKRTTVSHALVMAAACAAAHASHILLDWLSHDTSPPLGIMALWPFDRGYYMSRFQVFMATSRSFHRLGPFLRQNTLALVGELLFLAPLLAAVMMWRQRRPGR